jgi:molybdate transport system substrate-binding protein
MHRLLATCLLLLAAACVRAGDVQVAAASNLAAVVEKLSAAFTRDTGHRAVVALGSTGKFYAQIRHGAPFEVLLSADAETPRKLVADGLARGETQFTYALGRLVLWSARAEVVDGRGEVLRQPGTGKLAIADPRLAPYGTAAVEVLQNLNVHEAWQPHLVTGESIGQAYQFAATGNARLAFIALSQVAVNGRIPRGSSWVVPARLYTPIQQDAVLLNAGADNPAATAFLVYLRGNAARAILRNAGYGL